MLGLQILFFGWLGVFIANFAWFGNIFFFGAIAAALGGKLKEGTLYSAIGLLLGLDAFRLTSYPLDEGEVHVVQVRYLGIGYYLWLLSFAILLWHCLFNEHARKVSQSSAEGGPPGKTAGRSDPS
jgi:hypothetical protein